MHAPIIYYKQLQTTFNLLGYYKYNNIKIYIRLDRDLMLNF